MNGNDWANILYGEPTKFFPETRGYQPPSIEALSRLAKQTSNIRFPTTTTRKSLQDRLAEILDSPAFKGALKMMDAEGMAKVAKLLAEIDAATKTSQAKVAATGKETLTGAPEGFPWLGEARTKALAEIPPKKEREELTPEQKIAKREAELKADEWYRERALARETRGQEALKQVGTERREALRMSGVKLEEAKEAEKQARLARQAYVDAEGKVLHLEKVAQGEKDQEKLKQTGLERRTALYEAGAKKEEAEKLEREARLARQAYVDVKGEALRIEKAQEREKELEWWRQTGVERRQALYADIEEELTPEQKTALRQVELANDALVRQIALAREVGDEEGAERLRDIGAGRREALYAGIEQELTPEQIAALRQVELANDALIRQQTLAREAGDEKALLALQEAGRGRREALQAGIEEELTPQEKAALRSGELAVDEIIRGKALAREKAEEYGQEKLREQGETIRTGIRTAVEKEQEKKAIEEQAEVQRIKDVAQINREAADKRYNKTISEQTYKVEREDIEYERQEDKDDAKAEYRVTLLDRTYNWMNMLGNAGFTSRDIVEAVPKFLSILEPNKAQEEAIASALGTMADIQEEKDAQIIQNLNNAITTESNEINGIIKTEGITDITEDKIEILATLTFLADAKKMTVNQAADKWRDIVKKDSWAFGDAEIPIKDLNAQKLFKDEIQRILKSKNLADLAGLLPETFTERLIKKIEKLNQKIEKEPTLKMGLPDILELNLGNLNEDDSRILMASYTKELDLDIGILKNPPTNTRINQLIDWCCGDPYGEVDEEQKQRLPINKDKVEFLTDLARSPQLTSRDIAYLIFTADKGWDHLVATAQARNNFILPKTKGEGGEGEGEGDKSWIEWLGGKTKETIGGWFNWGKESEEPELAPTLTDNSAKIITEVDRIYAENQDRQAVIDYLTSQGLTFDEYKEMLKKYVGKGEVRK